MLLPVLISFLFLYARIVFSSNELRFSHCDYKSNYTSNSIFSTNLIQALHNLSNYTAFTGFNATTIGDSTAELVTALALCRGSLVPSDCQDCINDATLGILRACPDQTAAQVWYDDCIVRYSGKNFINQADDSVIITYTDWRAGPEPDSFNKTALFLLQTLSSQAVENEKKYAVGRTNIPLNLMLYGYVDCTRDINNADCTKCLLTAIEAMELGCLSRWFCWVMTPNCNVQFNMDPVHQDWPNAPIIKRNITVVPPPELQTHSWVATLIYIGFGALVILVIGMLWMVVVKSRERGMNAKSGGDEDESTEELMKREGLGMRKFMYDLHLLVVATDNFSTSNRLGRGGFGAVYKGKMPNGEDIAVKKLASGSIQGIEEFCNEVNLLLNTQHRNLVRLLGCCVQGEERMLVYEYLPNRSLDCTIFDKSKSAMLDWPKRYEIILGVARGLFYLHVDSSLKIIHRDIKATNILLDPQMNPKISDFGLAKLFKDEQSYLQTRKIAGTFGYMAPEYVSQGFLSAKSDVFSFGVLTLEIISGRKNYDLQFEEDQQELLNLTWRLEQEGRLEEVVDTTMGLYAQDHVLRCLRIGLLCCQECIQDRPTMSLTLALLSNNSETVPPSGRPAYHHKRDIEHYSSSLASMNLEDSFL